MTPADARHIDRTCDRFEAAWQAGQSPDPADYLGAVGGPVRAELLRQLLLLDWDYRHRAGAEPRAGDYLARFPDDGATVEAVAREAADPASTTVLLGGPDTPWSGDPSDDGADADEGGPGADCRYDLAGEVGRGGIGVVFRGRDRVLGRELAVKVLQEAYRDRPDARRRFAAEARVGSRLQHPAIVPVYELGRFADRRPFITMKLVEGRTLAELLRDRPGPEYDLPRLLGVFEQVCQAVAYAHNRGVVHRDLKPANVMVGAFGEVQVMDWGFAKVMASGGAEPRRPADDPDPAPGETTATRSGVLMGTPAYMPPEQARGEAIDRRADVFALGAVLCELLTGSPPYPGDTLNEVCRRAAAGELADAHARLDRCGADPALGGLARRCLTADPDGRPADAGAVAREVTAHRTAAEDRVRRAEVDRAAADARAATARRGRRRAVGLAAAACVAAAAAGWQWWAADRAGREAVAAAGREAEAKGRAEAKEAEAEAVLDFVQRRVFAAAQPTNQPGGLGYDVPLRQALAAALPVADTSFADRPLVEARLRATLGRTFFVLGDFRVAADQYRRAYRLSGDHRGPDHADTLAAGNQLARALAALGDYAAAAALHERVLAGRRATLGPDHRSTLNSMNNLGMSLGDLGQHEKATRLLEETLDGKRRHLGPDDPDTFRTMINLANSYNNEGRKAAALELREETAARMTDALGLTDEDTLTARHNLALSYRDGGRPADALALDTATRDALRNTAGPDHPHTLCSLWSVAEDLILLGRGADAVPVLDDCLARAVGQRVHPNFHKVADLRLRHFERANDPAGCRRTAELWEKQGRTDADSLLAAARCRGVAARLYRPTDRAAADAEADRAMGWLKQAVAAGYVNVAKLETDTDLGALQGRPDFRALVSGLKATLVQPGSP